MLCGVESFKAYYNILLSYFLYYSIEEGEIAEVSNPAAPIANSSEGGNRSINASAYGSSERLDNLGQSLNDNNKDSSFAFSANSERTISRSGSNHSFEDRSGRSGIVNTSSSMNGGIQSSSSNWKGVAGMPRSVQTAYPHPGHGSGGYANYSSGNFIHNQTSSIQPPPPPPPHRGGYRATSDSFSTGRGTYVNIFSLYSTISHMLPFTLVIFTV